MPTIKVETPLTATTKGGHVLSEKEEKFCNLYVTNYKRIEAVLEAYDVDTSKPGYRNTAQQIARENLLKPHINARIRELLDKQYMNDEFVDSEMCWVIQQRAEVSAKNAAIREYNLIKGRHAAEKHEHKFKGSSDEELKQRAAELISGVIGNTTGA